MKDISYFISDKECIPPYILPFCEGAFWDILTKTEMSLRQEKEQIVIGSNTFVHETAVIEGPVIIGTNCSIGAHAYIRPYTVIGNNCSIGHGSEIKASIICSGAKVSSLAFVGDSIIGARARVGSGVITANRNFDQGMITVKDDDNVKSIETKRSFLGCVLGDDSRLGANSTTQPGSLISRYCWVYPTTAIRGFIPESKKVFHEKPLCFTENQKVQLS